VVDFEPLVDFRTFFLFLFCLMNNLTYFFIEMLRLRWCAWREGRLFGLICTAVILHKTHANGIMNWDIHNKNKHIASDENVQNVVSHR